MRSNEPSRTALGVAIARSLLERPASPTGDVEAEAALTQSLVADAPDRSQWAGAGLDDEAIGDLLGWVTARTTVIDAAVVDALADGIDQVVLLGAGYDGRALRFRTPGVRFFEVDHPATQADKRARLDRVGADATGITFVAADFTEPGLAAALAAAGHEPGRPSLFVCEGVLRYLPEQAYRDLLGAVAGAAATGSRFVASVTTTVPGDDPGVVARDQEREAKLAAAGEAVLTVPERAVALAWIEDAGWVVDAVNDAADLAEVTRRGRLLVRAHPA